MTIREVGRLVEQVMLSQLVTGLARIVRPCPKQEVEIGLLIVIRREMDGQAEQGVRDRKVIPHGELSATGGQTVGLFGGAIIIGVFIPERLYEHDAVVVRNAHTLLLQNADGILIETHLERGCRVVARHGKGETARRDTIGSCLDVVWRIEFLERRDKGVGERIQEILLLPCIRIPNLEPAGHIVRLEATHVAVCRLHTVPHVFQRVGEEMGPRHDAVGLGHTVPRLGEGNLEKTEIVRVDVVIQQHIVDMPEIHIPTKRTVVSETEAETILEVNQLIHVDGRSRE